LKSLRYVTQMELVWCVIHMVVTTVLSCYRITVYSVMVLYCSVIVLINSNMVLHYYGTTIRYFDTMVLQCYCIVDHDNTVLWYYTTALVLQNCGTGILFVILTL
jgi:hypothetical protein